jgi:hypothetical protein
MKPAAPDGRPRFGIGDAVTVLDLGLTGHVRIPRYIRGRQGVVEQYCGSFLNPEELAVGRSDGRVVPLYRVRFAQRDVWPDYAGDPRDCLHIEIYEHWLQAAPGAPTAGSER